MSAALHVVLDDTAMVSAGHGNRLASELIHLAHTEPGHFLYAPACALVEADRARPGTAEHIAALPAVTIVELDLAAALAVARDEGWAPAHVRYAAEPTPERPEGAVIATAAPDRWVGQPVRLLDLTP
ncbi:hypothetical protein Ga0074812_14818 [Parafrankia irregularis]|uniref:PIN domain-containing protein n=1 Tax=Parafrankia irregularis TaxID=795642 RepID=A0A0S4R0W2_9ACTN|nr:MULTISPECIES: hypothetical protein [Parafrankia]MBE3206796.1 hypothetical protein [Parafrankia sp. CH37]CUU60818.1 hypothetical protein Ga0074812_14818 [Parafrankia irregularis]